MDILDLKNIPTTTLGYTLPPGLYGVTDIKRMFKSLLPDEEKKIIPLMMLD